MPVVFANRAQPRRTATFLEGLAGLANGLQQGNFARQSRQQQEAVRQAQLDKLNSETQGNTITNQARSGIAEGLSGINLPNGMTPQQAAILVNSGGSQGIGDILGSFDASVNRGKAVQAVENGDNGIASGLSSIAAGKAIDAPFVQNAAGQSLNQFNGIQDSSSGLAQANINKTNADAFQSRQNGLLSQQKASNARNGVVDPVEALRRDKLQLEVDGLNAKKESAERSKQNAVDNAIFKAERTIDLVGDARDLVNGASAGPLAAITSNIPVFQGFDLAQKIQTINSNLGIDELLRIKSEGGTFGALSDRELTTLQSSIANLNQLQDPEQLKQQLGVVEQNYLRLVDTLRSEQPGGGSAIDEARAAIQQGAPREAVMQRLQQMGIDPAGL